MKLTKFVILVNKTTSLFTSIRDSNISRRYAKILEIPGGKGGHTANPFRGGGTDIFWNHTALFLSWRYFSQFSTEAFLTC